MIPLGQSSDSQNELGLTFSGLGLRKEGGNATELDVVLRSHFVKHWKNGKFDVVTTEMTTEIIKLEI